LGTEKEDTPYAVSIGKQDRYKKAMVMVMGWERRGE